MDRGPTSDAGIVPRDNRRVTAMIVILGFAACQVRIVACLLSNKVDCVGRLCGCHREDRIGCSWSRSRTRSCHFLRRANADRGRVRQGRRQGVVMSFEPRKTWYVSFELPKSRVRAVARRSPRQSETFLTEDEARAFASKKFGQGLIVSAGTLNPQLPRRTIPSAVIHLWIEGRVRDPPLGDRHARETDDGLPLRTGQGTLPNLVRGRRHRRET